MTETNWFHDRSVDEPPRTARLGWLIWVAVALVLIFTPLVFGCSTALTGICAVQPIGQDEKGIAYFRYHCEPS